MISYNEPNITNNPYTNHINQKYHTFTTPHMLETGKTLINPTLAYKTWGTLSEERNNTVLICHALTGSCDVEDWWKPLLGVNLPFDPKHFFIICINVLGSPYGSTSPYTINPITSKLYGPSFPTTTVRDDVSLQKKLLLQLFKIQKIAFVVGGSMGGMHALEWACMSKPDIEIGGLVVIASSLRFSGWGIAWNEMQRQCIYSDPAYGCGWYFEEGKKPLTGLSAARMSALLTYRSRNSFETRFGRRILPTTLYTKSSPDLSRFLNQEDAIIFNEGNGFRLHESGKYLKHQTNEAQSKTEGGVYSAQSYLRYQGDKFVNRFDANCYIALTRKLDSHDIFRGRNANDLLSLKSVLKTLIIGIESDGLFPPTEQIEISSQFVNSTCHIIKSLEGHDGFLVEFEKVKELINRFFKDNWFDLKNARDNCVVGDNDHGCVNKNQVIDLLLW